MSPSDASRRPSAKLCLVGDEMVGKTSLIHRFVHGVYSPDYLKTIGAVMTKKTVSLPAENGVPVGLNFVIWDIVGKRTFLDLFGDAYFRGVQGVIAVFDLTRSKTLERLHDWLEGIARVVGEVPIVLLGNKVDLVDAREVSAASMATFAGRLALPSFSTSAKTGESVEAAFHHLAQEVRHRQVTGQDPSG